MNIGHEHIEYLQRSDRAPESIPAVPPAGGVPPESRCLSRVFAIGVAESSTPLASGANIPSSELPMSLYAAGISVAYLVVGNKDALEVYVGNWQRGAPSAQTVGVLHSRQEIIVAALRSLYPASDVQPLAGNDIENLMRDLGEFGESGYVLGLPTVKSSPLDKAVYPIDRVVRALRGSKWAFLVLAEPVVESLINRARDEVIEEYKGLDDSVVAKYYSDLLMMRLQTLGTCLGAGAWRSVVYLIGDASYFRLASVWRGVFSGDDSVLEPVRVWRGELREMIAKWAMSNIEARPGPGRVRRLLEHQTILSSAQLAAYLHLPRVEANGFAVEEIATFGAAAQSTAPQASTLNVGKILSSLDLFANHQQRRNKEWFDSMPSRFYHVKSEALTKHTFVAGVTGSGKTTTIFNMLKQAAALGAPFLVIEPAKTEYRELLNHPEIGSKLQIFTLADEQGSPLRINPFEVLPGTSIAKHIDLLRSLFSGSFGLWTPLPQILEDCLYRIYQDKGWDLTNDSNSRIEDKENDRDDPAAFPTFSDLLVKVDEVTSTLKWDPEATARIRGSLLDRLRSLRNGGRGRMLDVQQSLPAHVLFENPTVLELEAMGDDDDKAFMMGLLLIRLVEYRRSPESIITARAKPGLRHLLVFEEAHRLLANVSANVGEGAANPRAKAVETFANMLAEIRSYGQGVIVADQVPTKLSPDVIKNTNLKIAHRIVDFEDRKLLGNSMVMKGDQIEALARLLPGTAAVYSEGDDSPFLVQIDPGPDKKPERPDEAALRVHSAECSNRYSYRQIFLRHKGCTDVGDRAGAACDQAQALIEEPAFQRDFSRLVLSLIDDPTSLDRMWPAVDDFISSTLSAGMDRGVLTQCLMSRASSWYVSRAGALNGWSYVSTNDLSEKLHCVLTTRSKNDTSAGGRKSAADAIDIFRDAFLTLHKREYLPYPACDRICDLSPPRCLYRQAVKTIALTEDSKQRFRNSDPDRVSETTGPEFAWSLGKQVAQQLVEYSSEQTEAIQRIILCYEQMMLSDNSRLVLKEERERIFEKLYALRGTW